MTTIVSYLPIAVLADSAHALRVRRLFFVLPLNLRSAASGD